MKFINVIKSILMRGNSTQDEKLILTQKQCPQCTGRGMLVFKSDSNNKITNRQSNETKS